MQHNKFLRRAMTFILIAALIFISLTGFIPDTVNSKHTGSAGTQRIASVSVNRTLHAVWNNENNNDILGGIDNSQRNQSFIKLLLKDVNMGTMFGSQEHSFAVFVYFITVLSFILVHILRIFVLYIHEQDGKKDKTLPI